MNKIQNRNTASNSNTIPTVTDSYIAIGMIYTNTELCQWLINYTQKNVYSITSVNCLLNFMS